MKRGQIHLHTRASDGDITPGMILGSGLSFVAITNHDTLEGVEEFRAIENQGIELIAGIELTVRFHGHRLHVLVLEPSYDPAFLECLKRLQRQRSERIERVIERVEGQGVCLDRLDLKKHAIPTKWDIADAAVASEKNHGVLRTLGITSEKTFGRHFYDRGPADIRIEGLPAEEVLPLIRGIFILAHPGKSLDVQQDAVLIAELFRAFPFVGLEVQTRKHRAREQSLCAQVALELKAIAVTSNDAHSESHLRENSTPISQLTALRKMARAAPS